MISLVSLQASTPVANETQYCIHSPEVRVIGSIVCICKNKDEIAVSEHFGNFGRSVLAIQFESFEFWLKVLETEDFERHSNIVFQKLFILLQRAHKMKYEIFKFLAHSSSIRKNLKFFSFIFFDYREIV